MMNGHRRFFKSSKDSTWPSLAKAKQNKEFHHSVILVFLVLAREPSAVPSRALKKVPYRQESMGKRCLSISIMLPSFWETKWTEAHDVNHQNCKISQRGTSHTQIVERLLSQVARIKGPIEAIEKPSNWIMLDSNKKRQKRQVAWPGVSIIRTPGTCKKTSITNTSHDFSLEIMHQINPSSKSKSSSTFFVCSCKAMSGKKVAPICWVIPPASPSWTLVLRILSRSLVFPVSTCLRRKKKLRAKG